MWKGVSLDLGDGVKRVFPPLSFASIECMQERIGKFGAANTDDKAGRDLVIDVALASLQRNDPSLKREDVSPLIDMANMQDVMDAVMDVSGMKRKAQEAAALAGESAGN